MERSRLWEREEAVREIRNRDSKIVSLKAEADELREEAHTRLQMLTETKLRLAETSSELEKTRAQMRCMAVEKRLDEKLISLAKAARDESRDECDRLRTQLQDRDDVDAIRIDRLEMQQRELQRVKLRVADLERENRRLENELEAQSGLIDSHRQVAAADVHNFISQSSTPSLLQATAACRDDGRVRAGSIAAATSFGRALEEDQATLRAGEPQSQPVPAPESPRAREPQSQSASEPQSQRAPVPASPSAREPRVPQSQRPSEPKSLRAASEPATNGLRSGSAGAASTNAVDGAPKFSTGPPATTGQHSTSTPEAQQSNPTAGVRFFQELSGIVLARENLPVGLGSTRDEHVKVLAGILRALPDFADKPLDLGLISMAHKYRDGNSPLRMGAPWKYARLLKFMGTISAALKNLPTYDRTRPPILLAEFPSWRSAMAAVRKKKNQQKVQQRKVARLETVLRLIEDKQVGLPIRQLLALMWLTAGRPSDVLQLRREDIKLESDGVDGMSVTFKRGKTVAACGPRTIHMALPSPFKLILEPLLHDDTSRWLWEAPSKSARQRLATELNEALRSVDRNLACYSLRRGAIQHLSAMGVKDTELLRISGHTTSKQLQTYLDFGREDGWGAQRGRNLGTLLAEPVALGSRLGQRIGASAAQRLADC